MRQRVALVLMLTLALGAMACDDDDNPAAPSDPSSFTLTAALTPGNEVPPVTNEDASASGTVTVALAVTRDASNAITGGTANFTVNLTGFPAGTTLTGAHIHTGAAGVNGGVIVNTGIASGDIVLANGAGNFTRNGIQVNAATANAIVTSPGGHYFNVHTPRNPGGAVRGQLSIQP